ncbi:hypothetical protein KKE26_06310 [bacterium]|nr:hypothetical protein [bacterium]MBU1753314.1 hypothetical protein [bacterium]
MLCCEQCEKHTNCVKKWILGEQGMPRTCCFECPYFSKCFNDNMKKRWEIIHKTESEDIARGDAEKRGEG